MLTVANWSGTWPGLVGMLNLNGSLTKAGRKYSHPLERGFCRQAVPARACGAGSKSGVRQAQDRSCRAPGETSKPLPGRAPTGHRPWPSNCAAKRRSWACSTKAAWACSTPSFPTNCSTRPACSKNGSANRPCITKPRKRPTTRPPPFAHWMEKRGMQFDHRPNPHEHLTDEQILLAVQNVHRRPAHRRRFRLPHDRHSISARAEGSVAGQRPGRRELNNTDRPPVRSRDGSRVLYDGEPLPHFNEVDECAGLDGLMTYRVHRAMGQPVENTLHDLRWGDVRSLGHGRRLRVGAA